MDEIYEIVQQAKYVYVLGIDKECKIGDGWNVQYWPI